MSRRARPAVIAALAAALFVLTTGCQGSVSVGSPPKLSAGDVETQIEKQFKTQGATDVTASCPGDLTGKTGTKIDCDVTADDQPYAATITVTSVDGTDVKFNIDSLPEIAQDDVEQKISDELAQQVGQTPDGVVCPGPLLGQVGMVMKCVLSAGGDTIDVTATVTNVDGGDIKFDVKVADAVN